MKKLTIYVETVLFENFVVDYFLMWLTLKSLKQKTNWKCLTFSSIFGAVFALFSVKIFLPTVLMILLKIVVAFFMCFCSSMSFKKLFLKTLLFCLFTFCFGGLLIAFFSFLGISTFDGSVLGYLNEIPIGSVIVFVLCFSIFMYKLFKKFYQRQKIEKMCYDLNLTINGKIVLLKGFLDTGNTLTSKNGKPILILRRSKINDFFNKKEKFKFLLSQNFELKLVKSISGTKTIIIFEPEKCVFEKRNVDVAIGLCEDNLFSKNDFDIILSSKIMEV